MIRSVLAVLLALLAGVVGALAIMSFSGTLGPFGRRPCIELQLRDGVLDGTYVKRNEVSWDGETILGYGLAERTVLGGYAPLELYAVKGGADLILGRGYSFWVHLWVLFVLLMIYPLAFFNRWLHRRLRGRKEGHCHHCGSDLTGNTSGVCPECGEQIP